MGFRGEAPRQRRKTAPQKASGLQMILVFIAMAASAFAGYWVPANVRFSDYVPIPARLYAPIIQGVPVSAMNIIVAAAAFILLQFFVALISGVLFPLPPEELYDQDGLYRGKRQK